VAFAARDDSWACQVQAAPAPEAFAVAIQTLVRASRVDQMADQLAGETIVLTPLRS
jgi:hypothetical protein